MSIKPDALAAAWPCRTSVKVMVGGPAARADPLLATNNTTATMTTKHRAVIMISPARRKLSAVARSFT